MTELSRFLLRRALTSAMAACLLTLAATVPASPTPTTGKDSEVRATNSLLSPVTDVSPNYLFVDATGQRGASTGLSLSTEFTSRWEIIGPQGVLETVGAGTGIPFGEGLFVQLPIPSQSTILTIFSDPVMVSPLPIMSYERAGRLPYRTTIPVDGEAAGLVGVTEGDGGEGSAILARLHLANSLEVPGIGLNYGGTLIQNFTSHFQLSISVQTVPTNLLHPMEYSHQYPLGPPPYSLYAALWGPYTGEISSRSVLFSSSEVPLGPVTCSLRGGSFISVPQTIEVRTKVGSEYTPVMTSTDSVTVEDILPVLGGSLHVAPRWVLQRAISAHRAREVTLASHLFDQCDLNGDKLVDAADELLLLGTPEVNGWEIR